MLGQGIWRGWGRGRVLLEEAGPILKVRLCLLAPSIPAALASLPRLDVGSLGPERLSFRAERRKAHAGAGGCCSPGVPEERDTSGGTSLPEAEPFSPHPGKRLFFQTSFLYFSRDKH